MTITYTTKELTTLLTAALAIALTIAFDDGQPTFHWAFWLTNYAITALLTLIILVLFTALTKYEAHRLQLTTTYHPWTLQRFGFGKKAYSTKPLYLGIILPVLIAVTSAGKLPFGAALQHHTTINTAQRIGRKFYHLTEFERAKIAITGPISILLIALLTQLLQLPFTNKIITIITTISISTMLPLPNLNGIHAYLGSPPLYLFTMIIIILTTILIRVVNPALLALLTTLLAVFIVTLHYYYTQIKPSL